MSTPDSEKEEILFQGRPAIVPGVGSLLLAVLTLGLALLVLWARTLSRSYRITSQRVVVESGLFSKKMEQIDLYRINDYTVERPFGQRLLGTGNIVLETMDRTNPELRLENLPTDVMELYERLRKATEVEKLRRGVRVVDYE